MIVRHYTLYIYTLYNIYVYIYIAYVYTYTHTLLWFDNSGGYHIVSGKEWGWQHFLHKTQQEEFSHATSSFICRSQSRVMGHVEDTTGFRKNLRWQLTRSSEQEENKKYSVCDPDKNDCITTHPVREKICLIVRGQRWGSSWFFKGKK